MLKILILFTLKRLILFMPKVVTTATLVLIVNKEWPLVIPISASMLLFVKQQPRSWFAKQATPANVLSVDDKINSDTTCNQLLAAHLDGSCEHSVLPGHLLP